MSRYQIGDIQCSCGNLVHMELYESVNVTVDPNLLSKVKSRKIFLNALLILGGKNTLFFDKTLPSLRKNQQKKH